jgi:hypothetical protein
MHSLTKINDIVCISEVFDQNNNGPWKWKEIFGIIQNEEFTRISRISAEQFIPERLPICRGLKFSTSDLQR